MANPLTLYVPLKQDPVSQAGAQSAMDNFASLGLGLDFIGIVHYGRLAAIPNPPGTPGIQALLLITTFDGGMNPYLQAFWGPELQAMFKALMSLSSNPADSDDFEGFEKWINENNLPVSLYSAYPWTVKQVKGKFDS